MAIRLRDPLADPRVLRTAAKPNIHVRTFRRYAPGEEGLERQDTGGAVVVIEDHGTVARCAAAFCSPLDTFNSNIGRIRAIAALRDEYRSVVLPTEGKTLRDLANEALEAAIPNNLHWRDQLFAEVIPHRTED